MLINKLFSLIFFIIFEVMKKLIFILILIPSLTLSQQKTFVPDDDFELSLINLGIDNVVDDSVLTSSIDTVTVLYLGFFILVIYRI